MKQFLIFFVIAYTLSVSFFLFFFFHLYIKDRPDRPIFPLPGPAPIPRQ